MRTSNHFENHFKTIQCHEYLDRFEELNLLSKQSFENGLLDEQAEKWGKKMMRTPVDKQLLADFTRFRRILSKNIIKINRAKKINEEELDESVQRIMEGLIFVRFCEDKQLDERMLLSISREGSRSKGQLIKRLRTVFSVL